MKIKSVKPVGRKKVYDISVDDAEHYVLENGVVTHNTGSYYSADTIWILGRQQDKTGTEVTGYNFIINIEKSRYVREKSKIPITVSFDGGIQKYSGLLDIALEGNFVAKPSNGWYAKVDRETGEILNKVRFDDTQNKEFWSDLLNNEAFKEYVRKRYEISYGSIMQDSTLDEEYKESA
jgi:hypothetical protein